MTNSNDNKSYREVQQESHTDSDGNTHTNVTRTSETVNNNKVDPQSYQNGYLNGQTSERNFQEQTLVERDNENAGRGLLIGILLTALAALTGGALWYFNQRDQAVDNTVTPTVLPVPINSASPSPSPVETQAPQPQTKIIERTKEVPVPVEKTVEKTKEVPVFIPVPQQKAAPAASPATPNINITVPPQEPAAKQTPTTQTSPTPSSSSNSSSSSTSTSTPTTSKSGDSTVTPSDQKENKTDITPGSSSSTTENSNQDSSTP